MNKESSWAPDIYLKIYAVLARLAVLSLIAGACSPQQTQVRKVEASIVESTDVASVGESIAITPPQIEPPDLLPEEVLENPPIGYRAQDIDDWRVIEVINPEGIEMMRYLFLFKEATNLYIEQTMDSEHNPYTDGKKFRSHIESVLSQAGYADELATENGQAALRYLERYYLNQDIEDQDGHREPVPCVEAQIMAGAMRGIMENAPVSISSHPGDVLDLANELLAMDNGARLTNVRHGMAIRLEGDRLDLSQLQGGDTVATSYGGVDGHVFVVLSGPFEYQGEQVVFVFNSNRELGEAGQIVTNGRPVIMIMNQESLSELFEDPWSRSAILREIDLNGQ